VEVKLFEIRDRATCISAVGVLVNQHPDHSVEEWYILGRAGFGPIETSGTMVLLSMLGGQGKLHSERWNDRTMQTAHLHIKNNWDELESGAVVCVEHILGERPEPCVPDRLF